MKHVYNKRHVQNIKITFMAQKQKDKQHNRKMGKISEQILNQRFTMTKRIKNA